MPEDITWTDQKIVYAFLSKSKLTGYTAGEVEREIGRIGAHRRLPEMEKMGLARKDGKRVCEVTNRKRDVWFWDDSKPKPPTIKRAQAHEIKMLKARIAYLEKENATMREQIQILET